MKTKFLLPVLAMIFAIGMSFTSVKLADTEMYATGEILTSQGWVQVNVDCSTADPNPCQAYFESDPETIYQVYDLDRTTPLKTTSTEPFEISEN